jgi:beta-glucosidase
MRKTETRFSLAQTALFSVIAWVLFCRPVYPQDSSTNARAQRLEVRPWMNPKLSADERADMVLKEMTLDEKIELTHGNGMEGWGRPMPNLSSSNGGAGFVWGVPRLGIPMIQMSDAAYGVRASAQNGRYSTALPANIALAATWDVQAACEYGALIGRELRAQGYNMSLGGGVNLAREPRNGRTFEYQGEDPILAGTMVGNRIKCEQAQHVIGDIKHFALNDQESGRDQVNVIIGKRAMQESDLLAFHIGIEIGKPGAVMCAYNAVNADFACENKYLLTDVLKKDWNFKGFVVSDWGATHSTAKASAAGLDHEEPMDDFYGERLKQMVWSGVIPIAELNGHVRRILRSEFASGIVDFPTQKSVVDVEAGLETSRAIAEQSIVLLKNDGVLPLDPALVRSIAILGAHSDTGMISGAGSAQVDAPGKPEADWQAQVWFPTSPLKAIRERVPEVNVRFDSGENPAAAAALAKDSDAAIVFAYQWMSEDMDLPNLSLPGGQDALIEQVAGANPHTIVVLETGSAAAMPWIDNVKGVVEAWYAGSKGADAVARVLFGDVNPSAKLPLTFPRREADLPRPKRTTPPPDQQPPEVADPEAKPAFSVRYDEGFKVGYKWYDAENKTVLFPFGYGLSYSNYSYSDLKVHSTSEGVSVAFSLKNTGPRAGSEIAEVYVLLPPEAGEPFHRLLGWAKVPLHAGESKESTITIDHKYLLIYDESIPGWKLVPGTYTFMVGGSSQDLPLVEKLTLK